MIIVTVPRLDERDVRVVTNVRRGAMDVMTPRDEWRPLHATKARGPGTPGLVLSLQVMTRKRR
jgi:hypothetical protein